MLLRREAANQRTILPILLALNNDDALVNLPGVWQNLIMIIIIIIIITIIMVMMMMTMTTTMIIVVVVVVIVVVILFVGCLLNIPATCECISGTDLLRQVYVLPH